MIHNGHERVSRKVEHSSADLAQVVATLDRPRARSPRLSDVETIRNRARYEIASGAVTLGYAAGRDELAKGPTRALASGVPSTLLAPLLELIRAGGEIWMPRRGFMLHTPHPQSDPNPPDPGPEIPNPSVPPDMEPVVPQEDPPPGRGTDPQPPPVIAHIAYAWTSTLH